MGCGVLGVGLFPDNHHTIHEASSLTAFFFGGLATTLSFRASHNPFRTLAFLLGLTSLFFLFAGHWILRGTLGPGGIERWVAYPIVVWMVGYGAYVQARQLR